MPQPTPRGPKTMAGATNNEPELVDTIPITRTGQPRQWTVVMNLGPGTKTDLPMPDLKPGDKLQTWVELEVTTDAPTANHPGLMGQSYTYAPRIEARFLLAADVAATEARPGRATALARAWSGECSHQRHHQIIRLTGPEFTVPSAGLGWSAPAQVNVALSAAHAKANAGDLLLVGENEPTPNVDQDIAGIRVLRFRPAGQRPPPPLRVTTPKVKGIPVAKRPTVVFSLPLTGLRKGEQLFVRSRLIADADDVGYVARLSSKLFLADTPGDLEARGHAQEIASWKGNLSKENGSNCLRGEGPQTNEKFGVSRVLKDAKRDVYVNVVATSSAPFQSNTTPGGALPVRAGSFVEVSRFGPERLG